MVVKGILSGLFGKVLDNANEILDTVITTDKEREEAKLAMEKLIRDAEYQAFSKEVEDRSSARLTYEKDSIIQKILASLFTVAYFALTYIMFEHFVLGNIELTEYEIGFISSVFGAMSAKVNTIIDFFFGGSYTKK